MSDGSEGAPADVGAHKAFGPIDLFGRGYRRGRGPRPKCLPRRDGQNAATRCDDVAVFSPVPAWNDHVRTISGRCIETVDHAAFFISTGIAVGGHARLSSRGHRPNSTVRRSASVSAQACIRSRLGALSASSDLTFGIAKAHVVFDQARLAVFDHQPDKKDALRNGVPRRAISAMVGLTISSSAFCVTASVITGAGE